MDIEVEIPIDAFLPVYRHTVKNQVDVEILYGSRDTGKSQNVAQLLIAESLREEYMRCLLIRKTLNTIKESQVETIQDIVDDWNLSELFSFNKSVPSEIKVESGAKFYARGMDDPNKIKSFRNPSHAWIEELNELDEEDWILLITSLRTNNGRCKIWGTLNPKAPSGTDYREFWLWKYIFKGQTEKSFSVIKKIKTAKGEVEINIRVTHATYLDNKFCDPLRAAIYEDLKTISPYHYRINTLGEWANRENSSPFVLTFRRNATETRPSHLGITQRNYDLPVYLSFDFNRNPMCCSVFQWDNGSKVDWLEVIKIPNSNIWQVCDLIKVKYPDALFIATGDSTGASRSGLVKEQDYDSYHKVIQTELNLSDGQMQFANNPPIENNQVLVNWCFEHLDILINPDTCQPLIFDIEFGEIQADGKLKKRDRTDPAQQLDALDTFRYPMNLLFRHLCNITDLKASLNEESSVDNFEDYTS